MEKRRLLGRKEDARVLRFEKWARVRLGEKRGERQTPITVNSAHRGFMAVRRRGITPVVSRYILKSRAHARKSRTKLHTGPIEIVEKRTLDERG